MKRHLVVLGLGLLLSSTSSVSADDAWNPFREKDRERSRQGRNAEPVQRPEADPLPPMDGVARRPWLDGRSDPSGPQPGPGERETAFSRPGDLIERSASPMTGPAAAERIERGELAPIPGLSPPDTAPSTPTAAPSFGAAPRQSGPGPAADLADAIALDMELSRLPEMVSTISLPVRSPALSTLWRRLWIAEVPGAESSGDRNSRTEPAQSSVSVRLEMLYRSGFASDLARLAGSTRTDGDPVAAVLRAKALIAVGDVEPGCATLKAQQRTQSSLPKPLRAEFLTIAALCGAAAKDPGAAGLAADLLRAESVDAPLPLAALDALATGPGAPFKPSTLKKLTALDYRFLTLTETGANPPPTLLAAAEPILLAVLATTATDPATRIATAELALAQSLVSTTDLAAAYRTAPAGEPASDPSGRSATASSPIRRAQIFKAIEVERTPMRKTRLVRSLLDEVRRAGGPYLRVAALLSDAIADLAPAAELSWFAETAVELHVAGNRPDRAAAWAAPPAGERYGGLRHWLILLDIADDRRGTRRGEALDAVEQIAVRGRMAPPLMHRLVTVLDALDYQIPIPLWEAASRTPQPSDGHLPPAGVLTELKDAGQRKDQGRVVLAALRSIGPDQADTAHMIALGDIIRALKRAGLETDARRFGLEALFAAWPRSANN